jgi:hypothetical protein
MSKVLYPGPNYGPPGQVWPAGPIESYIILKSDLSRAKLKLNISGNHEQMSKFYEELVKLVQKHKKGIIPDDGK